MHQIVSYDLHKWAHEGQRPTMGFTSQQNEAWNIITKNKPDFKQNIYYDSLYVNFSWRKNPHRDQGSQL